MNYTCSERESIRRQNVSGRLWAKAPMVGGGALVNKALVLHLWSRWGSDLHPIPALNLPFTAVLSRSKNSFCQEPQ